MRDVALWCNTIAGSAYIANAAYPMRLRQLPGLSAFASALFIGALTCCVTAQAEVDRPAPVREYRHGFPIGYLNTQDLPDVLALLPPPPGDESAQATADRAYNRASQTVRHGPRGKLATADAQLSFPSAADTFACALGMAVTEAETPYLYQLLRRTLTDVAQTNYVLKDTYKRSRPYVLNGGPTCTPALESKMRKDGSYPSSHAAVGWAWALILAEAAPNQANAILARGLAFGDSRSICNVHWGSDINAGRLVGAATVAKLHSNPEFLSDLSAARAEIAAHHNKLNPPRDCAAESAALSIHIPQP